MHVIFNLWINIGALSLPILFKHKPFPPAVSLLVKNLIPSRLVLFLWYFPRGNTKISASWQGIFKSSTFSSQQNIFIWQALIQKQKSYLALKKFSLICRLKSNVWIRSSSFFGKYTCVNWLIGGMVICCLVRNIWLQTREAKEGFALYIYNWVWDKSRNSSMALDHIPNSSELDYKSGCWFQE